MNMIVFRNLNSTDRMVTKFLVLPTKIGGIWKWLQVVTFREDFVNNKWIIIE
jgi:hypothetical protein